MRRENKRRSRKRKKRGSLRNKSSKKDKVLNRSPPLNKTDIAVVETILPKSMVIT